MSQHVSDQQINKYVSHELTPDQLLSVDDHLAACDACMKRVAMITDQKTAVDSLRESLLAEPVVIHLTYEQIAGFVDDKLDEVDREIVELHHLACDRCRSEIDELRQIRKALDNERMRAADTTPHSRSWLTRLMNSPILKIAVPIGAVALLLLVVFLWRTSKPQEPSELANTNSNVAVPFTPTPEVAAVEPNLNVNAGTPLPSTAVASLNDAGGKIELDTSGKITGMPSSDMEQKVRSALKDQTVEIPSDVRQLKLAGGVLMGTSETVPFALTSPVGKVLETQRPSFSWRPLKDAESYKVGVYDDNFNQVMVSNELHSMSWTPSAALPRGKVYQWQVTAVRNGEEVKSPLRPAPEAKFKIVDQANFDQLQKARRSDANSHLVMGIAYANAGLLDEAEREFVLLLKNNPNSEIARKLLARIKTAK
jgi:anti-sigma factor RsiW